MSQAPIIAGDVSDALAAAGIDCEARQAARLAQFFDLLERWNRVHNLTAIRSRDELLAKHLVESLTLASWLRGATVADVGTGAGLPGLPLAVCQPTRRFTLIESRKKKVMFLRHAIAALKLDNVVVAHSRVENLKIEQAFATVLARAVAPPAELLSLIRPLTGPGSRVLLLTSRELAEEIGRIASGFISREPVSSPAGVRGVILALDRVESETG